MHILATCICTNIVHIAHVQRLWLDWASFHMCACLQCSSTLVLVSTWHQWPEEASKRVCILIRVGFGTKSGRLCIYFLPVCFCGGMPGEHDSWFVPLSHLLQSSTCRLGVLLAALDYSLQGEAALSKCNYRAKANQPGDMSHYRPP